MNAPRLRMAAAVLLSSVLLAGCDPTNGQPPDLPTRDPGPAPGVQQFAFGVGAYTAPVSSGGRPINVRSDFTLSTVAAEDVPIEGEESGVNQVTVRDKVTPYAVEAAMGPDLMAVSISVVAAIEVGQSLACWVETTPGQILPGSFVETTLTSREAQSGNIGVATVSCLYP